MPKVTGGWIKWVLSGFLDNWIWREDLGKPLITVVGKAQHMNGDREMVIRQMKGLQYFQFGNDCGWEADWRGAEGKIGISMPCETVYV